MMTEHPPIETFTGEPWEPWTPKIGDRVRIRLNGECQHKIAPLTSGGTSGLQGETHPEFLNGLTGVVIGIDRPQCPEANESGHRFTVDLPGGYEWGGRHWLGINLAAIELELLEGE